MLWVQGIPGAGKINLATLAIATARVSAHENTTAQNVLEKAIGVLVEAVAYFSATTKLSLHLIPIQ